MTKAKSSTAEVAPPKADSGTTMWSTTQGRLSVDSRYHGFAKIGGDPNVSYCGIQFSGLKRMTPPDRDAAVCEKCAVACGFSRRPGRSRSRRRGSRNLGTSAERIEAAVDRFEALVIRAEAVAK